MLVIVVVIAFALAIPASAMAAKKPTPLLTKVISNIDMDYAWEVLEEITAMGTSDMGFRGAGSASSLEASVYVRDELQAMGLTDVALEEIPLDAWEFRQAWVYSDGLGQLKAASFGGSPSTNGEITRQLVNVGNGFHSDYEGKDVTDKIVIANWIGDDYWTDSMAMEAYIHGAKAIIVTTFDSDYGNQPGAIECHDGLYRMVWPPLVSISGDDGLKLIAALEENPGMEVTIYSDIKITTEEQGGFGWNVVGYIPGKYWGDSDKDEFVILGDHTDSWFTGGMDDASGVAATLALAKAFKMTYDAEGMAPPERTLIFTTHEAEEYGIQDAYYDWCYGAWYQITKTHPDWVGKSVAYLNFELMGMAGLPLTINLAPELVSFVHNVLAQNNAKLPYGFKVTPIVHSWADHWMFTAAGLPGIEVATSTDGWDAAYYHNQFDTIETIDPTYLGQLFEVFADMTLRMVTLPIVPYNFEVSAKNLQTLMTMSNDFGLDYLYPVYEKYGLDPEKNMGRTMAASEKYLENARMLATMIKSADPSMAHEVNMQLMSIEAKIGQTLIAQGVWEQDWYPYQQSANDVIHMDAGIEMLKNFGMGYDVNDAIWELNWVGIMWYYDYMCAPNYYDQMSRLTGILGGQSEVVSWGLQTHLLPAVDLWDEYDYLKSVAYEDEPDLSWVISSLEDKMVSQALMELEMSFETMWVGLEDANAQMELLIASL